MLSIAVALVSGVATALLVLLRYNIYAAILTGFLVAIIVFFLITRHMVNKLQALQQRSIKQLEAQRFDQAVRTLEEGTSLARWLILGQSQLHGQIGYIYYLQRKYDKAFPYLKNAFSRNWMARVMLAACYYRRKEYKNMEETLEKAAKDNKKVAFVWGVYAYLLSATGKKEEALKVLARGTQACPDDKALKTIQLNLQNKKKMKMSKFGDIWYQLWLEPPPQRMIQAAQPRFSAFRRR